MILIKNGRFLRVLLILAIMQVVLPNKEVFAQHPSKKFKQELVVDKEQTKRYEEAEHYFDLGNFHYAQESFTYLHQHYPGQIYYTYMVGVCYLLNSEKSLEAVKLLEEVKFKEPYMEDLNFYLGKAYALNHRFDEAIEALKNYLNEGVGKQNEERALALIEECENAQATYIVQNDVGIENIGHPVNTKYSEYVPLISSDESVLIFTYRGEKSKGGLQDETFKPDPFGHFFEDIFITHRVGDTWLEPEPIDTKLNTNGHDACIGLSVDGTKLFLFKSTTKDGGDIYVSDFKGHDWSEPVSLGTNINTRSWEGSASLSGDGKTLYFSSDRPGGFGKRDIYKSTLQADGTWGKAENLGATINTKYDDDAPFIHPDGKTFYFSSKGHKSTGAFDIYKSLLEDSKWTKPENLGAPINTPGDDIYYVVNANGERGYYSSGKEGGFGLQDIYVISPGIVGAKPVLALITGHVNSDGKPAKATITIDNVETGKNQGIYESNSETGKYLVTLPAGANYKMAFEVDGAKPVIEYINVRNLDVFVDVVKDFNIKVKEVTSDVTDETQALQVVYNQRLQELQELHSQKKETEQQEKLAIQKEQPEQLQKKQVSFATTEIYKDLLKHYGDKISDGVSYSVEIESISDTLSPQYLSFKKMGAIKQKVYADGSVHYTLGDYRTLAEAEEFKTKMIAIDPLLAGSFITVFRFNQPMTTKDFFKNELLSGLGVAETKSATATNKTATTTDTSQTIPSEPANKNTSQTTTAYNSIADTNNVAVATSKASPDTLVDNNALQATTSENAITNSNNPATSTKVDNKTGQTALTTTANPDTSATLAGTITQTEKTISENETTTQTNAVSDTNALNEPTTLANNINTERANSTTDEAAAKQTIQVQNDSVLTTAGKQKRQVEFMNSIAYKDLSVRYADTKTPGVIYKMEMETLNDTTSASFKALQYYTKLEVITDKEGNMHFDCCNFETLGEAEALRSKLIQDDLFLERSFIYVVKDGEPVELKTHLANMLKKGLPSDVKTSEGTLAIAGSKENKTEVNERTDNQPVAKKDETVVTKTTSSVSNSTKVESSVTDNATKKENSTVANLKKGTDKKTKSVTPKTRGAERIYVDQAPDCSAFFADKDLNDTTWYNLLVRTCGQNEIENVVFKVQIGAYRFPQNFKYDHVADLGKVDIAPYPDGITRFTQLEHNSLAEAEAFRQIEIKKGIKDAWVTAFYKGQRIFLQDLIKMGLFKPKNG